MFAKDKYRLNKHGNFASKGRNSREYRSDDPLADAQELYAILGRGGTETEIPNGRGVRTKLGDGTVVSLRGDSKSGSPAVEIRHSSAPAVVKNQKIHFEHEER